MGSATSRSCSSVGLAPASDLEQARQEKAERERAMTLLQSKLAQVSASAVGLRLTRVL